jgi:hypothetical protein
MTDPPCPDRIGTAKVRGRQESLLGSAVWQRVVASRLVALSGRLSVVTMGRLLKRFDFLTRLDVGTAFCSLTVAKAPDK